MPQEKFTTTVVPFETKPIHTGTGAQGQPYTIYQVRARNMQGQEIANYPLRCFEQLTLHEPVEVECQLYNGGEKYGLSYTLKPTQKKAKKSAGEARLAHLEMQMLAVFERLGMEYLPVPPEQQPASPTAPPPAPAPAPPPAAAPAPPPAAPAPVSTPPQNPPVPPTQVAPSQQVQPEPPAPGSQYGEDPPF